jgi:hypothetical protein
VSHAAARIHPAGRNRMTMQVLHDIRLTKNQRASHELTNKSIKPEKPNLEMVVKFAGLWTHDVADPAFAQ